jgi:hypothetical protein
MVQSCGVDYSKGLPTVAGSAGCGGHLSPTYTSSTYPVSGEAVYTYVRVGAGLSREKSDIFTPFHIRNVSLLSGSRDKPAQRSLIIRATPRRLRLVIRLVFGLTVRLTIIFQTVPADHLTHDRLMI